MISANGPVWSRSPKPKSGMPKVFSFAHGVKEREVKVRDGAVALVSIPGIAQVAVAELEPASEVADENKRPFLTNRVVTLGRVGQVYDERVVQHGTVSFGHGFQSADELGQLLEALAADMGVTIGAGNTGEFLKITMADGMCSNVAVVPLQSQFACHAGEADSIRSGPSGNGCHVGQASDHATGRDLKLGFQTFEYTGGTGFAFHDPARLGVDFGSCRSDLFGHDPELSLPGAHGLEGIQVAFQFFLFGPIQAGLHAFDVVRHEVEQIGVDVKVLAGVSVRSGGEELLVGLDRVEEGGQSLALARGGEVVSDRHGLVRYAQSDVRVNAAQFAGEGGVDGFPIVLLAHGPATEGGKPRIVTTAGDAPGKAVNHGHFVGPWSQGFHGHAHGMIIQGPILHLGGFFGKFDSLWLSVRVDTPRCLVRKRARVPAWPLLARRFQLADER